MSSTTLLPYKTWSQWPLTLAMPQRQPIYSVYSDAKTLRAANQCRLKNPFFFFLSSAGLALQYNKLQQQFLTKMPAFSLEYSALTFDLLKYCYHSYSCLQATDSVAYYTDTICNSMCLSHTLCGHMDDGCGEDHPILVWVVLCLCHLYFLKHL